MTVSVKTVSRLS